MIVEQMGYFAHASREIFIAMTVGSSDVAVFDSISNTMNLSSMERDWKFAYQLAEQAPPLFPSSKLRGARANVPIATT